MTACGTSPTRVIDVAGQASTPVTLTSVLALEVPEATYAWRLTHAPVGSAAQPPTGASTAMFTPDLRGIYLVERWMRDGLEDDLTDEFRVTVAGAPPVPRLMAPSTVSVGATVALDGIASVGPEGRPLTFAWRLTTRPRDSAAALTVTAASTTSFVADVAGDYWVELAVFDGELWSGQPAADGVHAVP
jgi:hypothetical protein